MTLEGHDALVECVRCWDNIIVSSSRDTTIRRWCVLRICVKINVFKGYTHGKMF